MPKLKIEIDLSQVAPDVLALEDFDGIIQQVLGQAQRKAHSLGMDRKEPLTDPTGRVIGYVTMETSIDWSYMGPTLGEV